MAFSSESSPEISLDEALEEIERLTRVNEQLNNDLDDCKDQLFELLQKENDVPEQTVKEAFVSVFEGIDSWIDDISSDEKFDFKSQYTKNLQSDNRRETFGVLGLDPQCLELEWQRKLGQLETCHYVVLSLVIARCLVQDIFRFNQASRWGNIYPLDLGNGYIDFLVEIQKTMASDSLRRGLFPLSADSSASMLTSHK
jgi:hypothetical protein